jgi:hypothetical protein
MLLGRGFPGHQALRERHPEPAGFLRNLNDLLRHPLVRPVRDLGMRKGYADDPGQDLPGFLSQLKRVELRIFCGKHHRCHLGSKEYLPWLAGREAAGGSPPPGRKPVPEVCRVRYARANALYRVVRMNLQGRRFPYAAVRLGPRILIRLRRLDRPAV